ncbi:MAG: hypothetical protein KY448_02495 [Cyanobacteria bacterium 0813]|nr:hypothetical protein [Cyanobacteria bacterium 0813]
MVRLTHRLSVKPAPCLSAGDAGIDSGRTGNADRGVRSPLGLVRRADHTCHNQPYYLVRDRLNLWMR